MNIDSLQQRLSNKFHEFNIEVNQLFGAESIDYPFAVKVNGKKLKIRCNEGTVKTLHNYSLDIEEEMFDFVSDEIQKQLTAG